MSRTYKIFIATTLAAILIYILIPLPRPLFPNDYSTIVVDRQGRILRAFLNKEQQWCFPPDSNQTVPEKLKTAVLTFEDRYFYNHPGINPVSIIRAIGQNLGNKKIISGASTITMQVARLMKPKSRTYLNKIGEMLQALKIEARYSKDEILKFYLNHAPYGGNIVGYRAAILRYFQKLPQNLTWSEAALLAVLPNAPGLISPGVNPRLLQARRNRLLKKLYDSGTLSKETYDLSLREEVPSQSYPIPGSAAQLCRYVKQRYPRKNLFQTTIDRELQLNVEQLCKEHHKYLKSLGIDNLSVLVAATRNGSVKVYVGSANFDSVKVDGVQAARSSGSILKPFLFALSMDDGLILPQTLIQDIPTYFGPFSPANADQTYRGIVTARSALIKSLNVPAVRLLNKFGLEPFYYFLQQAGVRTLFRSAQEYGLPLILGGAEVNLWDMASLYRGLARGGKFSPLHVLKQQVAMQSDRRLISPGAAYLTLNILKDVHRPGAEFYWRQFRDQRPLAWKTGTSYGQRDGWAIGVNPQWTIAVWVGNFDGRGNSNLSGAACAGPLLFDIFNMLPENKDQHWFSEPDSSLKEITLCRDTGFLAGPDCPETISVKSPKGMKPLAVCPYHKKIYVSNDGKEQVCSLCWGKNDHHSVIRLIYPPQVAQYLRQHGYIADVIPPHRASCPALSAGNPLSIIYPRPKAALWIPRDIDGHYQSVTCRVAHEQKNRTVFWYLDAHYEGATTEKHVRALPLNKGWHNLEVIDDEGHHKKVRFYANLRK